ncbi:NUDIX hydrolase [Listeria costaricensis]|uniref:NUDIX hydrolase n=1 Tax=Listeria costaricensis TaxID=2026604 RepID=UPI000C08C2AC|nr:NUDIX domain-containing protein [Listeria costaricensis]
MKPVIPAVKAVIVKGDTFLALKKKGQAGDVYELPGGKMNFGETHGECLFREVYEETGLEVQPFILYDTWENFQPDYQITGVFYLVEMPENGTIRLSEEHVAYQFLPLEKASLAQMDIVFADRMARWDFEAIKGFMGAR